VATLCHVISVQIVFHRSTHFRMNMDDFILTSSNTLTPQTEILLYAAYLGHRPALFHSKINDNKNNKQLRYKTQKRNSNAVQLTEAPTIRIKIYEYIHSRDFQYKITFSLNSLGIEKRMKHSPPVKWKSQ